LAQPAAGPPWQAWLGEAVAIKGPTTALFRKQTGSNLLLIGQHEDTSFRLTASALISLGLQPGTALHLVVASALDAAGEELLPARLGPQRALFYTEDQGQIEKFRPYALPSPAWVRSLREKMHSPPPGVLAGTVPQLAGE